jgi:hypothetical protein
MFQKRILYDCNNTHILYKIIVCGVCATAVLHLVDTVRGKRVAKAKAGMAAMREGDDNNDNHGDDAKRGNASRGHGVSRSNSRGGGGGGSRGGGYGSTNNTPYSSVDLHSSSDRSDSGRSLTGGGVGGRDVSGGEGGGGAAHT